MIENYQHGTTKRNIDYVSFIDEGVKCIIWLPLVIREMESFMEIVNKVEFNYKYVEKYSGGIPYREITKITF